MNDASVKLLADLNKDNYKYVRLSTVVDFEYDTKLEFFKSRARVIFSGGFQSDKLTLLENAMTATYEAGVLLSLDQLTKVIQKALSLGKIGVHEKQELENLPLNEWIEATKKEKKEVLQNDAKDLIAAYISIADRHNEFKTTQYLLE